MRRLPAASTLGLILFLGFPARGEMRMEASMPMEMSLGNMLPQPGFRFYGWLDTGITANFDLALQVQFLYGSDARYVHTTGLLDLATTDIIQPDLPEAWILGHFPIPGTPGGA